MTTLSKQIFAAAIAAAAFVGFISAPSAQEAKKEQQKSSKAEGGDAKRAAQIAQSDMAEVQASKLAMTKAQSEEVKKYAKQMMDDHGKHLSQVRAMAKEKGMQLPSAPQKKHQEAMTKLEQASGAEFDKAYMQQMVQDHEEALRLVRDTAKNAKDPQLKADAEKTAPIIQKHLEEAKKIAASLK